MSGWTDRDRELVAIGAALGSNCVPCIEHHVGEAKRAGLSESEIQRAVRIADKVRQVPAKKVLDAAEAMLSEAREPAAASVGSGCGCGS